MSNMNLQNYQSNGMGMQQQQPQSNQAVGINSRELAKVQGEIFMAKQYPRNRDLVMQNIQGACQSKDLASEATYTYARGGTNITGASIRLAETVARICTNIKYGYEELEVTRDHTVVRCYAYDIESNVQAERTFTVPHVRYTRSKGATPLTDPRDIYEAVANNASRRIRACILEVVPSDMIKYALEICNRTLKQSVNLNESTRMKLLEAYKKYSVNKAMIEKRIQRNFEAITIDQYLDLKQVYKSIMDGIGKPEEFFDFDIVEKPKSKKSLSNINKIEKPKEPVNKVSQEDIKAKIEEETEEIDFGDTGL